MGMEYGLGTARRGSSGIRGPFWLPSPISTSLSLSFTFQILFNLINIDEAIMVCIRPLIWTVGQDAEAPSISFRRKIDGRIKICILFW